MHMGEKLNPELEMAIYVDRYNSGSSLYLGYDKLNDEWTLIIRHSGNIDNIIGTVVNECVYLLAGFAVIKIYTYNISVLQTDSRILYIDKSNHYSYGRLNNFYEKYISCVGDEFTDRYGLTGKGVCIGVIDNGLNIRNIEFRNDDGIRIQSYWNQNMIYDPDYPNRYGTGRVYDHDEIYALYEDASYILETTTTHGTEVTSVAAGSNIGVAKNADIVMVEQLLDNELPDTIGIMMGLDYLVRYSMENEQPMVINLSYGNNYGAHDGSSILEMFIDEVSKLSKINIVTGSGNDGAKALHTSGILGNVSFVDLDIAVSGGVNNFGIQVWKSYADKFDVIVYSPSYDAVLYLTEGQIVTGASSNNTGIYGIFEEPSPYSVNQLIYVFFQSEKSIEEGIWRLRLIPKSIINGIYNAYLPSEAYITGHVLFENSSAFGSLTIPATAQSIITVASYDHRLGTFAGFSGRGFTTDNKYKPDIAAPGVGVTVAFGDEFYSVADGTSISAAVVSGCAALLMQWGQIEGNDPFMYGERLKAQIIRGARPVETIQNYPNRYIGWGTVCMRDSFRGLIV